VIDPTTGLRVQSSLVICSRNRRAMLGDTIRSVLRGTELPSEIIVVDQSDQPLAVIPADWQHPQSELQYVWTPEVGLSRANNLGVRRARYPHLVFTHDDVLADPHWLHALLSALLAAGPRTVVTGRVPSGPPETAGGFQQTIRTSSQPALWERRTRLNPLLVLNMAIHRAALDQVGGFDERLGPGTPFPGAEDIDLGFRLLEAGYRIAYTPEAIVWHRAWRLPESYLPLKWAYGVALGGFFGKHWWPRDVWIRGMLTSVLRHRTAHALRKAIRAPRVAVGDALSVAGVLLGTVRWWWLHRTD